MQLAVFVVVVYSFALFFFVKSIRELERLQRNPPQQQRARFLLQIKKFIHILQT